MTSDDSGASLARAVEAYRSADRLDGFGFSGWIGREPHGASEVRLRHGSGRRVRGGSRRAVRRPRRTARTSPWLAVASFVNPHDIAFAGGLYEFLLGHEPIGRDRARHRRGTVPGRLVRGSPRVPGASSRPCGPRWSPINPRISPTASVYYYLHKVVDQAIGRVLDALEASGMADDTIVVFTSDHGDLLGSPRRSPTEVVQRLRRSDPGPVARPRSGDRLDRPVESPSRRATSTSSRPSWDSQASTWNRRPPGSRPTTAEVRPLVGRDLSGLIARLDGHLGRSPLRSTS